MVPSTKYQVPGIIVDKYNDLTEVYLEQVEPVQEWLPDCRIIDIKAAGRWRKANRARDLARNRAWKKVNRVAKGRVLSNNPNAKRMREYRDRVKRAKVQPGLPGFCPDTP